MTGCAGLPPGTAQLELDVTGPDDAWLHPGYASGVGDVVEIPGNPAESSNVCGIGSELIAGNSHEQDRTRDVILVSRTSHEVVDVIENADCAPLGGSIDDKQFITVHDDEGWQLRTVDLRTGAIENASEHFADEMRWPNSISGDGAGGAYLTFIEPQEVMHVRDGSVQWRTPVHGRGTICRLINAARIGCTGTTGFDLIDTEDGSLLRSEPFPEGVSNAVWTSDAVVLLKTGLDDEQPLPAWDLDGDPLGDIDTRWPRSHPGVADGVFITLADVERLEDRAFIAPTGEVLAYQGEEAFISTLTGAPIPGTEGVVVRVAVTADGTALVFDTEGDTVLVDETGTRLADLGASSGTAVHFVDGYLVTIDLKGPSKVHLPAK